MQVLKKVLDKLNGYAYGQEYLCLNEPPGNALHAYIVNDNKVVKDITNHHVFTGYCPLIFAFDHQFPEQLEINFSTQVLLPNDTLASPIAELQLRTIRQQGAVYFYEGISGRHHFVSGFHQLVNGINNKLHQQKPGNVYLDHRLYPQVQIAYALPRQISLISLQLGDEFNLFPTDLHGQINPEQYIISLRQGGLACQQVQQAKTITVSSVRPSLYKEVYKLGKNHMQPPKPREAFNFSQESSTLFNLPLPQKTIGYRELELRSSFDHGIHHVLLFDVKNHQKQPGGQALTHIHNSYATWLLKHGAAGNYLLR